MEYDGKNLEQAINYLINMEEEVLYTYSEALEIENAHWWKRWWLRRQMSKSMADVYTQWSRLDLAALRYDYIDTIYNHHKVFKHNADTSVEKDHTDLTKQFMAFVEFTEGITGTDEDDIQ